MTSFNSNRQIVKSTMLTKHIKKTAILIFSFSSLFIGSYNAFSQARLNSSQDTIDYHSNIPDTFHGGYSAADNTNIMLILDSSTSMGQKDPEDRNDCINGNPRRVPACAARFDSRSSKVRRGILDVFEDQDIINTVNFGLMSFNTNEHENNLNETIAGFSAADNGAILRLPIKPLTDNAHLDELKSLLAQEEDGAIYDQQQNYFGLDENGAINSFGGTPIEGSLLAGLRYFTDDSTNEPALDLLGNPDPPNNPGLNTSVARYDAGVRDGSETTQTPSLSPPQRTECPAQSAIILLTDGAPTRAYNIPLAHPSTRIFDEENGTSEIIGGADCTDNHLNCAIQIAKISRNVGVPVYVIGFSTDGLARRLNSLAQAGSGRDAFDAESSEQVSAAIKTVLENFNTASASASNASVTTAGLTSRGSIVQARFTPFIEKDIDGSGLTDDDPNERVACWKEMVYH